MATNVLTDKVIQEVTDMFMRWVGYCEKTNLKQIGIDLDNPESFTGGAGYNNFTIFAKVYAQLTGINVQGQPWCDTFIDTLFIHKFGVDMAKKLLGGFSAYTPDSAKFFQKMGRYYKKDPKPGDIIFFKNDVRIYHTGYVYKVTSTRVYTIEGNTSSGSAVVANGGLVAMKDYPLSLAKIDGYGRPDYSLVATVPEGWMRAADNVRWWYQYADGSYARSVWKELKGQHYLFDDKGYACQNSWHLWDSTKKKVDDNTGHWYLFDNDCHMCRDWHKWNGKDCDPADGSGDDYYLWNSSNPNDPNIGICIRTRDNGAVYLWKVE